MTTALLHDKLNNDILFCLTIWSDLITKKLEISKTKGERRQTRFFKSAVVNGGQGTQFNRLIMTKTRSRYEINGGL